MKSNRVLNSLQVLVRLVRRPNSHIIVPFWTACQSNALCPTLSSFNKMYISNLLGRHEAEIAHIAMTN